MNVPYPGSGEPAGALASTALMVVASLGLCLRFRRRGWL
jgi:Mg2+ and Co2+ transporter CorA